jgi:hypothetical protein
MAELNYHPRDVALDEPAHEAALVYRGAAHSHAGHEQQLSALEQAGDVRDLAGVRPSDRPGQALAPGNYSWRPASQRRQAE